MPVNKMERHELEMRVFQLRSEAGLQSMRSWLYDAHTGLNDRWPGLSGEELSSLQGEARIIRKLIVMIDVGPTIKTGEQ